jgi:hypothetical protein
MVAVAFWRIIQNDGLSVPVALGPGEGNRASRAIALAGEHGLVKGSEAGDVQRPTTSPSRRRCSGVV